MKFNSFPFLPVLLCLTLFFTSCQKKQAIKRALLLSKIEQIGELSTLEVQVSKLILGEYSKVGKVLFIPIKVNQVNFVARTYATIKLGIDLHEIKRDDIVVRNDRLFMKLPPIKINSFNYPADNYEILHEFSKKGEDPYHLIGAENIDRFYELGELTLRDYVDKIGLRPDAENSTRVYLTELFSQIGFQEVNLEFEKPKEETLEESLRNLENLLGNLKEDVEIKK